MIVKVCGMRDPDNILAVERTGIDWMGFIFYRKSSRYAGEQAPSYLPTTVKRVGVFVNDDIDTIMKMVEEYGLDKVQLHGSESPEFCRQLADKGIQVIKVFSIAEAKDIDNIALYEGLCEHFLFDTKCKTVGGSGVSFDWSILELYKGSTPFILSGGLGPDSMPMLEQFHHKAWAGIDLNSGFEISPAMKDADALRTFINKFKTINQ